MKKLMLTVAMLLSAAGIQAELVNFNTPMHNVGRGGSIYLSPEGTTTVIEGPTRIYYPQQSGFSETTPMRDVQHLAPGVTVTAPKGTTTVIEGPTRI